MQAQEIIDSIWNGIEGPDREQEQEDDDQCH